MGSVSVILYLFVDYLFFVHHRGNGWVADEFERTLKSPTYLMAFIVSDFDCTENDTVVNPITVKVCFLKLIFTYSSYPTTCI